MQSCFFSPDNVTYRCHRDGFWCCTMLHNLQLFSTESHLAKINGRLYEIQAAFLSCNKYFIINETFIQLFIQFKPTKKFTTAKKEGACIIFRFFFQCFDFSIVFHHHPSFYFTLIIKHSLYITSNCLTLSVHPSSCFRRLFLEMHFSSAFGNNKNKRNEL